MKSQRSYEQNLNEVYPHLEAEKEACGSNSMTAFLVQLAFPTFPVGGHCKFISLLLNITSGWGDVLHTLFIICYLEGVCCLLGEYPNVIPKNQVTTYGGWKKPLLSQPTS